MNIKFIFLTLFILASACQEKESKGTPKSVSASASASAEAEAEADVDVEDINPITAQDIDGDFRDLLEQNRSNGQDISIEESICKNGRDVVAEYYNKSQMPLIFDLLCKGEKLSELFEKIMAKAYDGEGTPQLELVKTSVDDGNVSEIIIGYAIKSNLSTTQIARKSPFEIIAGKVTEFESSKAIVDIGEVKEYPGNQVSSETVLNYRIDTAEGAAVVDKKSTVSRSYLLNRPSTEVSMLLELIEVPETSEYHAVSDTLTIIFPTKKGSIILSILRDVIINRIDGERMIKTIQSITKGSLIAIHKGLHNSATPNDPKAKGTPK